MTTSLEMQFEKFCSKAFFGTKKKRYALRIIWKEGQDCDIIETRGFETRRSDSCQFSKALLNKFFEMVLRDDLPKEQIIAYIKSEVERIRNGNFTYLELGIPKGITKNLDDYKIPSANIRGVKWMQEQGIELSNKPRMVYVKKRIGGTDVICFDEESQVPSGTEVDVGKMLEKTVKNKLKEIFEALGWKITEVDGYWKPGSSKRPAKEQLSFQMM